LTRFMLAHGDDRQPATIVHWVRRMASGEARVSGEMRVLLAMMASMHESSALTFSPEETGGVDGTE
ncbi:MAG: hypothetical protein ACRYHQ_26780, partial [Janthinobacterium lividum]